MPVPKPLDLPFDPIARAAEIWERRFGDSRAMAAVTSIMRAQQIVQASVDEALRPLLALDGTTLRLQRREKFLAMGGRGL